MKRSNFLNRFRMVAKAQGELADADAFVVLGFGLREENGRLLPGASNEALAKWIIRHNPLRLPTITQEGVYQAIQALEAKDHTIDTNRWVIPLPHDPKVHVDTHGAALQCWLIFNNTGIRTPAVVAHPYQSERSRRIFEKLPLDKVIIPDIAPASIPFTPSSTQRWTRNLFWYTIFEFCLARPIGRLFGWL